MQQTALRRGLPLAIAAALVALLGLAGLTLALSGGQGAVRAASVPGAGGAAVPAPPRLVGFALTSAPAPPVSAPAVALPSFSTSTDHELYAHMVWANVGGTYDAYLIFLTPNGETYEVLDVPFTTGPAPAGVKELTQQRPGVLHPVRVQVATPAGSGSYHVVGELPIAGTAVPRLLGTWQVQVRLGPDPTLYTAQKFTFTR